MSPCFIFSASTYNTLVDPPDAFLLMKCLKAKAGLASCYDLLDYRRTDLDLYYDFINEIKSFSKNGVVYIDSGNYEASRFKGANWSREDHLATLADLDKDYYYFSFDNYEHFKNVQTAISETAKSIDDLLNLGISINKIIVVLHVKQTLAHKAHNFLNKIISGLTKRYDISYIAIPERDIGDGLYNKLNFISTLRSDLDSIKHNIKIHLLGTGNPVSMLLFHGVGAATFDGLEWCRQSIDYNSALLFHPQQYDLFHNDYTTDLDPVKEILENPSFSYVLKMALHNATFMKHWDNLMTTNKMDCVDIIKKSFPKPIAKRITDRINI